MPTGVFRESDDEYSDDDDMSWKVRRSAAKCVEAVISTRHEMLAEFYRTVSPALIARFKGTGPLLAFAVCERHVERLLIKQMWLIPQFSFNLCLWHACRHLHIQQQQKRKNKLKTVVPDFENNWLNVFILWLVMLWLSQSHSTLASELWNEGCTCIKLGEFNKGGWCTWIWFLDLERKKSGL